MTKSMTRSDSLKSLKKRRKKLEENTEIEFIQNSVDSITNKVLDIAYVTLSRMINDFLIKKFFKKEKG